MRAMVLGEWGQATRSLLLGYSYLSASSASTHSQRGCFVTATSCRSLRRTAAARHVASAWSTAATDRRAPMRVGTAVSAAMASSVSTIVAKVQNAGGSAVGPVWFGLL